MWIVFVILVVIFLILTIRAFARASPLAEPLRGASLALGPSQRGENVSLPRPPETWDEKAITRHLDDLRGQPPSVVTHYIESVLKRIVVNQNDKTALVQVKFLKTKVEELKLFKEGQQILVDIETLRLEREKRLKTLLLENAQLDNTMRTRSERDRLVALKEHKEIERDIARIEKEIAELKNPSTPAAELSPEEKRARERKICEERIANLKAQKKDALRLEEENDRVRTVNAIDTALEREYERWSRMV